MSADEELQRSGNSFGGDDEDEKKVEKMLAQQGASAGPDDSLRVELESPIDTDKVDDSFLKLDRFATFSFNFCSFL